MQNESRALRTAIVRAAVEFAEAVVDAIESAPAPPVSGVMKRAKVVGGPLPPSNADLRRAKAALRGTR